MPRPKVKNSTAPFVKIILPALAGIGLSRLVEVPAWAAAAACFLLAFVPAVVLRKKASGQLYILLSVLLFFFGVAGLRRPASSMPHGKRLEMAVRISEPPYSSGRWQRTTARVGYFRCGGDEEWRRTDESVMLYIDSCHRGIGVGTQLVLRGWFNPVDTVESSYRQLMRTRGIHGRVYLVPGNLVSIDTSRAAGLPYYAARLQEAALDKLGRLRMEPDRLSVVTAMVAGDKRPVDKELRAEYSLSGSAHLLAVSGLHVGIVFVLVNILLYLLPAARRGHIVKNAVAIAAIWVYACMAGLSPSAVRAALMFSFAQAALATSSQRHALNIMLGSMIVMLAVNPNYIADISFQLSWAAVLAIFAFYPSIYYPIRTRYPGVNAILAILVIGVTATAGTAPLISYYFGNMPLGGIVAGPLLCLTSHVIVMLGTLWTAMPFGFGQPVFEFLLSIAAGVQNAVVKWCAEAAWMRLDVRLPLWAVVALYIAGIAIAAYLYIQAERRRTRPY